MILVIDACHEKCSLSFDEFVKPVIDAVSGLAGGEARHFLDVSNSDIRTAGKIIICGTALMDNGFMEHIDRFQWLREMDKPVLGICAGMQIIAKVFGGKVEKKGEIGMVRVSILEKGTILGDEDINAYELHNFSATTPKDFRALAKSSSCVQAFRHKSRPIYGVMFHPEVRNREIIRRFAKESP